MSDPQIRLFVALEVPAGVRAALGEVAARLRTQTGRSVRWVHPENLHLTLKFIGEVEADKKGAIEGALSAVRLHEPVVISFRGIGYIRHPQPRVFAAAVEPTPALRGLVAGIESALVPLGIPAESREFFPHLTLARLKSGEDAALLRGEARKSGADEIGRAAYHEFDLMQSTLRPDGAVYTRLARFPFAPPAAGTSGAAA